MRLGMKQNPIQRIAANGTTRSNVGSMAFSANAHEKMKAKPVEGGGTMMFHLWFA